MAQGNEKVDPLDGLVAVLHSLPPSVAYAGTFLTLLAFLVVGFLVIWISCGWDWSAMSSVGEPGEDDDHE